MTTRQIPPQSIESEMAVLGGIFVDNAAIDTAHTLLTFEDFYRESHRLIFRAMSTLADKNEPIDLVTLSTVLKTAGDLDAVGGGAYLYTLVDYVPTSANIAFYCKDVVEKATSRKILECTKKAEGMIYANTPSDEVVAEIERAITSPEKQKSEPLSSGDALSLAIKELKVRSENRNAIQGISYGLYDLDVATNGLSRGDLVIVAGRPSMGKTSFALNILESACSKGHGGLLFSLEMSTANNVNKIIASNGGVKYQNIRSGRIEDDEWARITHATNRIYNWNMRFDDTPAISFRELRSKARRLKKRGLDLVVVDYLQLMTLPQKDSRVQALGEVSRGLKQLARELDLTVIALSQLNRSVDSRQEKRPTMSDLRDSGEIEQDADVILFPFRPAAYCQLCRDNVDDDQHNLAEHQSKAEIIIEKQRNGERNVSIPAVWLGQFQKFANLVDDPF